MTYEITTLSQRPQLGEQVDRLSQAAWPAFLHYTDPIHWDSLFSTFADYQIFLCAPADKVIAVGLTIPFIWDGTLKDLPASLDELMERAIFAYNSKQAATTLSALAVMVAPECRNQNLSATMLREMRSMAVSHKLHAFIVPVRPTMKSVYPLTPFDRYVQWRRVDGAPFDPWMRTHWRLGAQSLQVMARAMTITGSVAQWEEWTKMQFPESGQYVVPGALQIVSINRQQDRGSYDDPNIWMQHPLTEQPLLTGFRKDEPTRH